jgi:hypothetical protein
MCAADDDVMLGGNVRAHDMLHGTREGSLQQRSQAGQPPTVRTRLARKSVKLPLRDLLKLDLSHLPTMYVGTL